MALSSFTVWEIRTIGNDANGGGFVAGASGTDYSQQDAAQYSGTDLAVDAATNTKVTSASHSFVAADVGNLINIAAGTGWTAGFYQIVSVSAGAATLDRSPAATSTTGGSYAVGGALATPGGTLGQVQDSNIVFYKYNTSPIALTTATPNVAGGPFLEANFLNFIRQVGYDTTRTVTNSDANHPTVKAGANNTLIFIAGGGSGRGAVVRNLIADANGFTGCTGFADASDREHVEYCQAVNCATGFNMTTGGSPCDFCESVGHTSNGFLNSVNCFACVAHDGVGNGFNNCTGAFLLAYNNAIGFVGGAFGNTLCNATAFGNTSHGFDFSISGGRNLRDFNCLAYGNGGFGFKCSAETIVRNCAGGNNTSGNITGSPTQSGFVALSANPFTNAVGGNFALNATAGGGAACRASGFPGVFPGGLTTGYTDIGAAQHQDSGGGLFTNSFSGGML